MLPALIKLGFALAYGAGAFGLISHYLSKEEEKKYQERINKIPGGLSRVKAVQFIHGHYQDIKGIGIPVSAYGHSWEACKFELKLKAAEANCDIVVNVTKNGNKKDGFCFQGIAYQKRLIFESISN